MELDPLTASRFSRVQVKHRLSIIIMSALSDQIRFEGGNIRYDSPKSESWSIPLADVRLIGESTNQSGPVRDDYFLCFSVDSAVWYEASLYADGLQSFLSELGNRLNSPLELALANSVDFASRILWPTEYVGESMFEYEQIPPATLRARLFRLRQVNQRYSSLALELLS